MSRKLRAMRDARERRKLEGAEPCVFREFPDLQRTLIIVDYDFGRVEHRIDLYRTRRIDCYRAVADGVEWKRRIGWPKVLAGLRVKFPGFGRRGAGLRRFASGAPLLLVQAAAFPLPSPSKLA